MFKYDQKTTSSYNASGPILWLNDGARRWITLSATGAEPDSEEANWQHIARRARDEWLRENPF